MRETGDRTERIADFVVNTLGLPRPSIKRVHQMGKHISGKHRTSVAKFTSSKDKETMLSTARMYKSEETPVVTN